MNRKVEVRFQQRLILFSEANNLREFFVNSSSLLVFLILLASLASCGGQKTSATLQVTNSALSVANSTYSGGLVIMGKSSEGEFTVPVSFGSGSGNSVTLELTKGVWTFSAVAWEGANPFEGDTLCSSKTVDITKDKVSVNLDLSYAKCALQEDAFGDNTYHSGNAFRSLQIATCKALYQNTTPDPVDDTTPISFCNNSAVIDAAFKDYAKSVKIEVKRNLFGSISSGLSTGCYNTNAQGVATPGTGLSIPTIGLPVSVTLYDDTGCPSDSEKIIAEYEFPNGLAGAVSGQDTYVNDADAGMTNLFLPANRTKRGYSGFIANQPMVTCSGAPCVQPPTSIPSSKNRIISSGSEFIILDQSTPARNCATISSISPTSISGDTGPTIAASCRETSEGQLAVKINYGSLSASPQIVVNFSDGHFETITLVEESSYHIYHTALAILGYPLTPAINSDVKNSMAGLFENKNKDRGILTAVSDFFAPEGPAGILGDLDCATAVADETVNFFEDGKMNYYRIKMNRSPLTTHTLIADGIYTAATPYDTRVIAQKLRSLSDPVYDTMAVVDVHCGVQVGRFESMEKIGNVVEKRIQLWNTRTEGSRRSYNWISEVESDASGIKNFKNAHVIGKNHGVSNEALAVLYELKGKRTTAPNYDLDVNVSQVHMDTTTDRMKLIHAEASTPTVLITDSSFDSALTTVVSGPGYQKSCTDSGASMFNTLSISETDCIPLLETEASAYTYGNLRKSAFDSLFTANFEAVDVP